ncbi:MAG: alanine--tRNA ligase [Saprospiraceae bacterium]
MRSNEIRQIFFDYFASKGHKIVPSAPIVNKNDPTLMFTNAGMNQFKDFFLGNKKIVDSRVADTQKCLRVSGKHNDLEDVGIDSYHHTMFEMLGNWSFGDYFKQEAISWAWDLLTNHYKIAKDRIYVTVFEGDVKEGLSRDDEAAQIWERFMPLDRILSFNKKDNFWEMGDTGPCGPCTEIHVDIRTDEERANQDGAELVNNDHPQVIEIWNNVFIQYNRKADGSLEELPAKHVDTGMGFERLCMVLQGKSSNYDTDIFATYIKAIEEISGVPYTSSYDRSAKSDIAMRVVSDHIRAVAFTIADGELPGHTGAGYVVRRILRRAVRYYYSFLNIQQPLMYKLIPMLADQFANTFPELKAQSSLIGRIILEEEKSFLRTLEAGLKRLDVMAVNNGILDGKQAFELYDTYGFPIDLTRLILSEKNQEVDEIGFNEALAAQKARSRADAQKEVGDWRVIKEGQDAKFVGYEELESEDSSILKVRQINEKGNTNYQLVLDKTPFYAESGGQIGDTGILMIGEERVQVLDTKRENDLIIHLADHLPEKLDLPVTCIVDSQRRAKTERNHSATHLLHAALRSVLGTHVHQKGSLVGPDHLRFDFSHFEKVSATELKQIEQIVNAKIREDFAKIEARDIPIEEARASGAMMLFGEKYADKVRMITFDPSFSRELCGGCHVRSTGQIGYFKIVSESAIAAGIRRIEALTAEKAEAWVEDKLGELSQIKEMLNNSPNPLKALQNVLEDQKSLQKAAERFAKEAANQERKVLQSQFVDQNGFRSLVANSALTDVKVVKNLAYELLADDKNAVVIIGFIADAKPFLMIAASEDLAKSGKIHAGNLIKILAGTIGGGGGGQAFFATAGGSIVAKLADALDQARQILTEI